MKTPTVAKTNFTYYKVHLPGNRTYGFKYEREARHFARTHNLTYYEVIYSPGLRDLIFL